MCEFMKNLFPPLNVKNFKAHYIPMTGAIFHNLSAVEIMSGEISNWHNRINKVHLYSGLLTGATVCFLYYGYKRKQLQKFSTLFRCGYSSYFALLFISGSFITFRYLMKFLAESSKSKAAIGSLVSLIMVLLGKTYFTHIELQRH